MDRRPFRAASLGERTRRGAVSTPAAAGAHGPAGTPVPAPLSAVTAGTSSARRHCWVSDGTPAAPRAAGLLVEWRQLGGAWQGRVAYVVDVDGEATLVEAWVPASQLERASEA